jgi:endogenous inhibitor of DNA gyrase (YacG/DUF329 family)
MTMGRVLSSEDTSSAADTTCRSPRSIAQSKHLLVTMRERRTGGVMTAQHSNSETSLSQGRGGLHPRLCSWCGAEFGAARLDAALCSARCRTAVARYAARMLDAASRIATARCQSCGQPLTVQTHGRPRLFCSDACRQRACRRRRDNPQPHTVENGPSERPARVRVCSGPTCTTVFVVTQSTGRPRQYCSTACRSAAARRNRTARSLGT